MHSLRFEYEFVSDVSVSVVARAEDHDGETRVVRVGVVDAPNGPFETHPAYVKARAECERLLRAWIGG